MTEGLEPGFELLPDQPPAPPRRHGKLIGSIVAVVVLAGGGAATYVAFAGSDGGADSPKAAVQKVVADLENADLIGFVDDLAPGERAALAAPIRDDISSLKRLGVLSGKADPSAVSGFSFKANNLVYADKTIRINDHVQIVQITSGSVDLSAQAAKLPLTKRLLDSSGGPATGLQHQHQQISPDADPMRIATEQVGGRWYASLFYTVADQAAEKVQPTSSDRIPARGASSAEAAVQKLLDALLKGNPRAALELISPAELGAVHDYGGLILERSSGWDPAPVKISTLDLTTKSIADGGVRVMLHRLVATADGQRFAMTLDNGCATIDAPGFKKKICAADAAGLVNDIFGAASCAFDSATSSGSIDANGNVSGQSSGEQGACASALRFKAAQKRAIADIFTAITKVGVDTAKVGGSWYVTPVRTFADEGATVLSSLKGDDLFQLAKLGH